MSAALMVGVSQDAAAQTAPVQNSVSAAVGLVNFDVDGVATTVGLSGRASIAVTPRVAVEANLSWARNDETGTSDMWVAEAHVHYFWQVANRVRPYAGGGAGIFINQGEFLTDRSLTLSAAGGLRVDLTDRMSALGEFRIRGVEIDFAGSLVEIWGGLTFRLGN
jgi:hypothetical protein